MAAEQTTNKRRLVRTPPPVMAAAPDELDNELEAGDSAAVQPTEEEEPKVRTRKQAALEEAADAKGKKKIVIAKVETTDDLVRKKNGEVRKDEDGDDMRYSAGFHSGAGFVNENGVRFPPGYKFRGGFIGTFGNVIMNRCPECGHQQSVDESRTGICGNQKCRYDAVAKLEEFEP